MQERKNLEDKIEEQKREALKKEQDLIASFAEGSQTQQGMYDRVSNFENSPSKAFTDCSSKKTNIRLEETPLSAVGSEMNFTNQYRMMGTSDTSFGEY